MSDKQTRNAIVGFTWIAFLTAIALALIACFDPGMGKGLAEITIVTALLIGFAGIFLGATLGSFVILLITRE